MAEQLLWPLPFGKTLTGGFADSRPDHFHGGVDLRTGPEAREVIAPTAGFVERIAVSPNGYGRTIYFRLSDGRTAVFGHLSKFIPRLESLLRNEQLANGTYRVDFATDSTVAAVQFRRGETICYTGQSGMGPPHLHFELREGAVQTDPLASFAPFDTQKPVISSIRWIELSQFAPESSGSLLSREQLATMAVDIVANSPVGLFIQCYDPGPWGRHAVPSEIKVLVDNREAFRQACGRIDLLGDKDIYEQVVWAERIADNDVRRLFIPPYANATSALPAGWIAGPTQQVSIQVSDRAGNVTEQNLTVQVKANNEHLPAAKSCYETRSFKILPENDALASWSEMQEVNTQEVTLTPTLNGFGDRVKLQYRLNGRPVGGLYFFQRRDNGSHRPLWRIPDETAQDVMSCYILKAGTYGVADDLIPPTLYLRVKHGRIYFTLKDSESGIDDSTVRCKVDGTVAIPEYEYEEDGGFVWARQELAAGTHHIEFEAADRAGNVKTWNETVTIPRAR